MTKYVLDSGGLKKQPERARRYVAEVVQGLGTDVSLLLCFFAEPDQSTWTTRFDTMRMLLQTWAPDGVTLHCALARVEQFEHQVAQHDAIYIHGGITDQALAMFSKYDVPKLFAGKVVATNSASTHMLSVSYWTADERVLGTGLGIVPIRTIAHYKSDYGAGDQNGPVDWQQAYEALRTYGDTSLPIYALEEGEFVVVNQGG